SKPFNLTFTVSNVQHGEFSYRTDPTVLITQFTMEDILQGLIQFTHNGDEEAPSFDIVVSDGDNAYSQIQTVKVSLFTNVNDAPVFVSNELTIAEGETKVLTGSDIKTRDDNDPSETLIDVVEVHNGYFSFISDAKTETKHFSQQDVYDGKI